MPSLLKPAVNNNDHRKGNKSASIELVEYGDFQCSHCGAAYPVIKNIQTRFGNRLSFVFRNFPLSNAHPFAFPAAVAAEAAALQGKFWEMHDIIFENQCLLSKEGLLKIAAKAGLDIVKFKKDIKKDIVRQKVDTDFQSGMLSGVKGTPTFFINGIKFEGGTADLLGILNKIRNNSAS